MFRTTLSFSRVLFCKNLFRLTLLTVLIGLSSIIFLPNHKISGQAVSGSCATCRPPVQQVIYTPLIELKEASSTEINLNCRSAQPIDVVPTFYTDEGVPIVGDTIHLAPAEMRFAHVQSLIPAEIAIIKNGAECLCHTREIQWKFGRS